MQTKLLWNSLFYLGPPAYSFVLIFCMQADLDICYQSQAVDLYFSAYHTFQNDEFCPWNRNKINFEGDSSIFKITSFITQPLDHIRPISE